MESLRMGMEILRMGVESLLASPAAPAFLVLGAFFLLVLLWRTLMAALKLTAILLLVTVVAVAARRLSELGVGF